MNNIQNLVKRNFGYDLLERNIFPLSHTTRNAERGGNCSQETDGDLKNGLPCVCFHLTHFDSIFKRLNLNSLCVSHEVNFPSTVRCPRRCRPVLRRPYCRRLGGTSALAGAAALLGVTSCRSATAWVRATTI